MTAYAEFGVDITVAQSRGPMGRAKRDHIVALMAMPRIAAAWAARHGHTPGESDIGEGRAAATWTVGITVSGNEVGLSHEEGQILSMPDRRARADHAGKVPSMFLRAAALAGKSRRESDQADGLQLLP